MSDELVTDRIGAGSIGAIAMYIVQKLIAFAREWRESKARADADKALSAKLESIHGSLESLRAESRARAEADAARVAADQRDREAMWERIEGVAKAHGGQLQSLQKESLQRLARLEQAAELPQWVSSPSGVRNGD